VGHRQPATSTVTFALLAPIFLLMIFGAMEGGRIFSAWLIITNEAREAARYGAVRYDPMRSDSAQADDVRAHVYQRINGVLSQEPVTPGVPNPRVDVSMGTAAAPNVTVTIYYEVDLFIPLVSAVLPDPFALAARSSMSHE
jgi:Flp pilus assembly protein TadG